MANTIALPSPADRHPSLIYEHHPRLGDYIYSQTIESWTQRRALHDGQPLLLCGRGRCPSDEQIALWSEIDARLPELTAAAVAAVEPPPIKRRLRIFGRKMVFSRDELALGEVRMGRDGLVELFFDTPTGDKIDMWPIVTFLDWHVTGSEWVC